MSHDRADDGLRPAVLCMGEIFLQALKQSLRGGAIGRDFARVHGLPQWGRQSSADFDARFVQMQQPLATAAWGVWVNPVYCQSQGRSPHASARKFLVLPQKSTHSLDSPRLHGKDNDPDDFF
jgi:hypothetical protein